nr:hypothetical protein [uncultured Desulfuromonas sp.]
MKKILILAVCLVAVLSGCVATSGNKKNKTVQEDTEIAYTLDMPIVYVVPRGLNLNAKQIISKISSWKLKTSNGTVFTDVMNITDDSFELVRSLKHYNNNLGYIERSRAVHKISYSYELTDDSITVKFNPVSLVTHQIGVIGSWKTYELNKTDLFDILSTVNMTHDFEFKSEFSCVSLQSNFERMAKKQGRDKYYTVTESGVTFRCLPEFFPYRDGCIAKVQTQFICTPDTDSNVVNIGNFLTKVESGLRRIVTD